MPESYVDIVKRKCRFDVDGESAKDRALAVIALPSFSSEEAGKRGS